MPQDAPIENPLPLSDNATSAATQIALGLQRSGQGEQAELIARPIDTRYRKGLTAAANFMPTRRRRSSPAGWPKLSL